jgi:hypothetical protein
VEGSNVRWSFAATWSLASFTEATEATSISTTWIRLRAPHSQRHTPLSDASHHGRCHHRSAVVPADGVGGRTLEESLSVALPPHSGHHVDAPRRQSECCAGPIGAGEALALCSQSCLLGGGEVPPSWPKPEEVPVITTHQLPSVGTWADGRWS